MFKISVVRHGDRHATYWAVDYDTHEGGDLSFYAVERDVHKRVSGSCQWVITQTADVPADVMDAVRDGTAEVTADD